MKSKETVEELLKRLLEFEEYRFKAEFGAYFDKYGYDVELAPRERRLLIEELGTGRLYTVIAHVTMPDDTPPNVWFEVTLDEMHIIDWTCEEYYKLLFFSPGFPGYGGVTIYDTTRRKYAWFTDWAALGSFKDKLLISLVNGTDAKVKVDVWDAQYRLVKRESAKG